MKLLVQKSLKIELRLKSYMVLKLQGLDIQIKCEDRGWIRIMKIGHGLWHKISGIHRNIELFLKGKS
jgi:hypothetical protein